MKTTVEIQWDKPQEQIWLNADNIQIALSTHCRNTRFNVREINLKYYGEVGGFRIQRWLFHLVIAVSMILGYVIGGAV
jgi:hypothetical protein